MEGLASSFMFTLGGLGFIVLDQTHASGIPKLNRTMLQVNIKRKIGKSSQVPAAAAPSNFKLSA